MTFSFWSWLRLSVSSMNCSRIEWNLCPRIRLNADLFQAWVLFWTCRFPLHIIRRENSVFPYFTSFPMNLSKEGQRAKEGKVLTCTHTLLLRKTSEKGTEKWKLSTVAANSRSDEFTIGVILSTENDRLERLWNNSQNLKDHTPTG